MGTTMSPPFEHLLLATEHSEFDAGAERIALALAQRCQLPLDAVLPIVSNAEYEAVAPQLAARAEAEAAERLRAVQAAASAAGVNLQARVRRGAELDAEIVDEAQLRGSDLIIARRRGKRGFLARLLVGEMVSRVVAHSPCSVLLVPRSCGLWTQRVLLALDPALDGPAQSLLMQRAVAVAAECALPLSVLCVTDGSAATQARTQTLLDACSALAAQHQVPLTTEQRQGKPFEQIIAAAQAQGADLLVLGRHGGALTGRAWLGSTTQKVIGLAERPVLVVIPQGSTT